jgi:hypothetical protein
VFLDREWEDFKRVHNKDYSEEGEETRRWVYIVQNISGSLNGCNCASYACLNAIGLLYLKEFKSQGNVKCMIIVTAFSNIVNIDFTILRQILQRCFVRSLHVSSPLGSLIKFNHFPHEKVILYTLSSLLPFHFHIF